MQTAAIVPVKSLEQAKQRLTPALAPGYRRALMEAMFADTLIALRRSKAFAQILVVTADKVAARIAEGEGATVVEDGGRSHSEAAVLGISAARADAVGRVLLLPGDCPLLDPAELKQLLAYPTSGRSALIIPDRHGDGTNALLLTPPDALTPAFGPGSRQRHAELARAQGSVPEVLEVASLGLDIDTPDDFEELERRLESTRGGAAHTRGMLNQLTRSRG